MLYKGRAVIEIEIETYSERDAKHKFEIDMRSTLNGVRKTVRVEPEFRTEPKLESEVRDGKGHDERYGPYHGDRS